MTLSPLIDVARVRAALPDAARHWDTAFAGEVDAVGSLIGATPNDMRALVASALWMSCVNKPALQRAVRAVWTHDYRYVIELMGAADFRAMCRDAEFDLSHLPARVTIWRGGYDLTPDDLRRGIAWTIDRAVAEKFCQPLSQVPGGRHCLSNELLIGAEVPRSQILAFIEDREESEVVLARAPRKWWVDQQGPAFAAENTR